tara:strand:+ start:263 stop:721 length:459 start_codon:yes stop_codon:yes gene_type:complete
MYVVPPGQDYPPMNPLGQPLQGLDAILMPLQGIQGPLQQIVDEMPGQINSYVDEEIQRRMDEMKSTPSPTPTPTDPVGPPQDPFQTPMPFPFPRPRPSNPFIFPKDPGIGAPPPGIFGGLPKFLLDRIGRRQGIDRAYQIPRPIAGLPSIFG